jgi:hypothetical protein
MPAMSRPKLEAEIEVSGPRDAHPSLADLERFMHCELEDAELQQAIVRHLLAGCEKCRAITGRLWNHGAREPISLVEMLASPKTLARHRRRAKSGKWDPRMSAAVASLESVAREILKEYVKELEGIHGRLEILAAGLARVPRVGEPLQAAIACVLHDTLRPAIDDLRAAAESEAEPDEEEAETA